MTKRKNYRTRQGIFDTAYKGIRAQGFKQAVKCNGVCAYTNHKGHACAIGHCIPKYMRAAMPSQSITFKGWHPPSDFCAESAPLAGASADILEAARIRRKDARFAYDLQRVHDHPYNDVPENMQERLMEFARQYNLTVPA